MSWILHNGDCRDVLETIPSNSIDAIVTDPPYELGFMGKEWDASGIAYNVQVWAEALRVLKPGGHLLAFGGTRTYHRMACAIEDAGFDIRDMIEWCYGSGFPKSLNVSKAIDKAAGAERRRELRFTGTIKGGALHAGKKDGNARTWNEVQCDDPVTPGAAQWQGWGTALKPAHEPICVARKPIDGTVADNVLRWGTGGINVDGGRVGTSRERLSCSTAAPYGDPRTWNTSTTPGIKREQHNLGRWPANLILSHDPNCTPGWCELGCPVRTMGEQSGKSKGNQRVGKRSGKAMGRLGAFIGQEKVVMGHADSGTAARFFAHCDFTEDDFDAFLYCAKAGRKEREAGCGELAERDSGVWDGRASQQESRCIGNTMPRPTTNHHPTVKPIALMRYLVRLVTPPGGTVLDPFAGSGTTGCAAVLEGCGFVGIELAPEYAEIARARIAHWESRRESKVQKPLLAG